MLQRIRRLVTDFGVEGGAAAPTAVNRVQACVLELLRCHKRTRDAAERAETYAKVYAELAGKMVNGRELRTLMIKYTPAGKRRFTLKETMSRSGYNMLISDNQFVLREWKRKYEPATEEAKALVQEYNTKFAELPDDLQRETTLDEMREKITELGKCFQEKTPRAAAYELHHEFSFFLNKFQNFAYFLMEEPHHYQGQNQDEFDLWTAIQPLAIAEALSTVGGWSKSVEATMY